MLKNKFHKEQIVTINNKSNTKGTIIGHCRYFQEVDTKTNEFKPEGHAVIEDSLTGFQQPYELIGDTLKVYMPEGYYGTKDGHCKAFEMKYIAKDFIYTVEVSNMNLILSEDDIRA